MSSYVVRLSGVMLMYCGHLSWATSNVIIRIISQDSSFFAALTSAMQCKGEYPQIWGLMCLRPVNRVIGML